jgi:2-polyprenyl-3-methyl-5-hydroxy-6-metoxy-1,4-benzoquinol methylase
MNDQNCVRARAHEATAAIWDAQYNQGTVPWRSAGLSNVTTRFLTSYARGPRVLEIGCGTGEDRRGLSELNFDYQGIDSSSSAIGRARSQWKLGKGDFIHADFFRWSSKDTFDVVYDKGVFHGLSGVRRRNTFTRRLATILGPEGIWTTVCGSADHRRSDFCHGAIYLRDLVGPAELYFEVLEIVRAPYGLTDSRRDFGAWYGVFRRR